MTGWIVAAAIYAVAAVWVPITLAMANRNVLRPPRGFFNRVIVPAFYIILWPLALCVALFEWGRYG
jgi:predicted PurR-regulated permease PerM